MNGQFTMDFTKLWADEYGKCPPVGYLMREAFREVWFRIHTLPDAKRYADTPAEGREILRRHNALLSFLLQEGDGFVVVLPEYSYNAMPSSATIDESLLKAVPEFAFTSVNEEDIFWHFYTVHLVWTGGVVNELLKMVANEDVSNVLFVGTTDTFSYHPYDGGADIFIWDRTKRQEAKARFHNWLSTGEMSQMSHL